VTILDIKRLNQIKSNTAPSLADVVEIVSENILTTSRHSKDIKAQLATIMELLTDVSSRLSSLESKNSNIFQIEIDDESEQEQNEDDADETTDEDT
jgi:hypothetical protein